MKVQDQRNTRRKSALDRLESQLKKGTKPSEGQQVPLEDKDKERIKKEISTLKNKILY